MTGAECDADVAVVGSGAAGLTTALRLAPHCRVVLVTKGRLGGGASAWAQGGIAAAVAPGDTPALHAADTAAVGGALVDQRCVDLLTAAGPDAVRALTDLGAVFERDASGALALGREAGHSARRVVHAGGDATGAEIMRALVAAVRAVPAVDVHERTTVDRLLTSGGRAVGLRGHDEDGRGLQMAARAVVLATGGLGQLFAHTTNPVGATGDGLDLAAAAGACLVDLEFVQFHPTALARGEGGVMPLLTEALRGAGAPVLDEDGRRFLFDAHPAGELAPRDVVARAIEAHRRAGHEVGLDLRGVDRLAERFPTAWRTCRAAGYDPTARPVPVAPAAHYSMGGVEADAEGVTSVAGLYAVGEVACTGVHGANRLASNSLLEALVFGDRVAARARRDLAGLPAPSRASWRAAADASPQPPADDPRHAPAVRALLWDAVGVVRDEAGLAGAYEQLVALAPVSRLARVGLLVTAAARARRESRGGHYRRDHPLPVDPPRRLRWQLRGAHPVQVGAPGRAAAA